MSEYCTGWEWHLSSKQQWSTAHSSADCKQIQHTLYYSICSLMHRRDFPVLFPSPSRLLLPALLWLLLDEGHALLVVIVPFVVLFLLPSLAGLRAVVGHLHHETPRTSEHLPHPLIPPHFSLVHWIKPLWKLKETGLPHENEHSVSAKPLLALHHFQLNLQAVPPRLTALFPKRKLSVGQLHMRTLLCALVANW